MRVLIADPFPIVHAAIRAQIEHLFSPPIVVGPLIDNGNEALRLLTDEPWDLFVTEIVLSARDGLQVIRRTRSTGQTTPSLVLTALDENVFGLPAVRAGALGFVHKSAPLSVLRRALRRVAAGHRFVSDTVADHLAETFEGNREDAAHDRLSGRERQIFLMLSLGHSVKEIADELCVARKTIYSHRARILKKIGAGNDRDLRRYAFAHGIVPSRRLSDIR
jgi:DNA-binding NarL/FixJ family response regulator